MKENALLRIALVFALVGVFTLFMVSNEIAVDETSIDKINKDNLGEMVKIHGHVGKVTDLDNIMIFTVTQPNDIDIFLFKQENNISIFEGQQVEVIGKVDEYNGKLEVIGERVRVIG